MPTTLPITYDRQAPGTRSIFYSVGGVPLDMTGYTARMQVHVSGSSTTSAPLFTLTETTGVTVGSGGSIVIDMTAFEAQVVALAAESAVFHHHLDVRQGSNPRIHIASGPIARNQP